MDISVGDKECVAVFEFVTNEACKGPPTPPEMPCSLYSDLDNKRRDLTPLIKLKGTAVADPDLQIREGGGEVRSSRP